MGDRRQLLWQTMLDAEMYANYWQSQQDYNKKFNTALSVVIALASSGSVANIFLLTSHPDAQRIISGIAGALSIICAMLFSTETLTQITSAATAWNDVAARCRVYWADDKDLIQGKNWEDFKKLVLRIGGEPVVGQSNPRLLRARKEADLLRAQKEVYNAWDIKLVETV